MPKRSRGKRIEGHFLILPDYMTNSEAWQRLSFRSIWLYIELMKKNKGRYGDELSLSYSRAIRERGLSSATLSKCFKELKDLEFIKLVRPGGFHEGCSVYAKSDSWFEVSKKLKSEPRPQPRKRKRKKLLEETQGATTAAAAGETETKEIPKETESAITRQGVGSIEAS